MRQGGKGWCGRTRRRQVPILPPLRSVRVRVRAHVYAQPLDLLRRIDDGAPVQQQPCDLELAVARRVVETRKPVLRKSSVARRMSVASCGADERDIDTLVKEKKWVDG